MSTRRAGARNDRLWYDVHGAHMNDYHIKVLQGDLVLVQSGRVIEIDDDGFVVRARNGVGHQFEFTDGTVRIER